LIHDLSGDKEPLNEISGSYWRIIYMSIMAKRGTSIREINDTFAKTLHNEVKNIHFYTKDPIESIDINNSC